ncbi:MAG: hypothetical protein WA364_08435 [Candidatus Nitrosopolaris sp.]
MSENIRSAIPSSDIKAPLLVKSSDSSKTIMGQKEVVVKVEL